MSPKNRHLNRRLDGRLAAYATLAGATLAAPAVANADIVWSGLVNITVPNNTQGIYLNFVTGQTGTAGTAVPGWNFNPYNSGSGLNFFWPEDSTHGGLTLTGTTYATLPINTAIGSGATFIQPPDQPVSAMTLWRAGANAYLGVRFINSATNQTNFGWVHLQTTGAIGFPATIIEYAFQNNGQQILAGQIPEPTTTALLGVFAVGALGVRAWRKRKAA